ncbi:MAG: hypothetical protein U9N50_11135 [Pseudomonadota bacterium]|nr:hypothetical protein [Pseudomonadota bacterium]
MTEQMFRTIVVMTTQKPRDRSPVIKGTSFLLERLNPEGKEIINTCRIKMTKGNAQLDPGLSSDKLVTRWRLWAPENWAMEKAVD